MPQATSSSIYVHTSKDANKSADSRFVAQCDPSGVESNWEHQPNENATQKLS